MKKMGAWLRLIGCMLLLSMTLSISGCAWFKAGDPLGKDPALEDGRDAAEMDVDDPVNPDDSEPSPGALP